MKRFGALAWPGTATSCSARKADGDKGQSAIELEAEFDAIAGLMAHRYRLDRRYKILVSAERQFYAWPNAFKEWIGQRKAE